MPRHQFRVNPARLVAAAGFFTVALAFGVPALAQTTTTTAPVTTTTQVTTPATTAPATPTTAPTATTASSATVVPVTSTTVAPLTSAAGSDSGSSIPWIPIVAGVVVLALIIAAIVVLARRRGARRAVLGDWLHAAAETTADAGTTARLLSTGAPVSRQIAQQVLASLRAFEDLTESAPDDDTHAAAERGRRAIQSLGLAIDADYRTRRAEPRATQGQLDASADALRNTASDVDRTLRRVYRGFTDAD